MALNVVRGIQKRPRRQLVYGPHGVGKSTWMARHPNPIFLQTEDGANDLDVDRFPIARSIDEVIKNIDSLISEKHQYKTLCLDSLDWLEAIIFTAVCKEYGVNMINDIDFGKGYVQALKHWRVVLKGLSKLREEKGMTILLSSHCVIERFCSPDVDPYDRYAPKLHKHASALIQEWCDEVFFLTYKVMTKVSDDKFGVKTRQGIGTGERVIKTTERPAFLAKNRLGMADEIPFKLNGNGSK